MGRERRDTLASTLGVTVFVVGVALVAVTFWQAWSLFSTPPELNLGVAKGQPVDFGVVGLNTVQLLVRVLLLVVMAGIGSALATRGARMYASGVKVRTPETENPTAGAAGPAGEGQQRP